MDKQDILRMAREANGTDDIVLATYGDLHHFAALIAAAEREACAKVVENHALGYAEPVWSLKLINTIRERSANAGARGSAT